MVRAATARGALAAAVAVVALGYTAGVWFSEGTSSVHPVAAEGYAWGTDSERKASPEYLGWGLCPTASAPEMHPDARFCRVVPRPKVDPTSEAAAGTATGTDGGTGTEASGTEVSGTEVSDAPVDGSVPADPSASEGSSVPSGSSPADSSPADGSTTDPSTAAGSASGGSSVPDDSPGSSGSSTPGTATGLSSLLVADGFASVGTGTTGGAAGTTVAVSTLADLKKYAADPKPYVIRVNALIPLSGDLNVASNKTIVGAAKGAGLTGGGLHLRKVSNVIIANLAISKAVGTDAVGVWGSHHVFITHNDFSSDLSHGKDYYDGLIDITKGSDNVTVSWNVFHHHFKVMLIGASDKDGGVDIGKEHVTIHHNWFHDFGSRVPSLRFGTGHVYDNLVEAGSVSGIHSRMGAQILVQANVFAGVTTPTFTAGDSSVDGFITLDSRHPNLAAGSELRGAVAAGPSRYDYPYTVDPASAVLALVKGGAGPR